MKKIITLILLFISLISIGQTGNVSQKIKDLNDLYNKRKFQKVEILSKEILNNQYGKPTNEDKCNTLSLLSSILIWDDYENKNYELGYNYTLELLDLWKNGMDGFPDKESNIQKITTLINDLENKHPELKTSKVVSSQSLSSQKSNSNEPNSSTKTDTATNKETETTKPVSDDKTVTLTVSGTGKTLEEAKLNALRSAIEQAFGAFISSKTEILNDNLIKDEIVSVASGNVQKYDIVSQVEVPSLGYAITLSATVSISKLTSFAESKGVVVEFKGGLFAANIKLQKFNEKAEEIAIRNLMEISFVLLEKSIDYKLDVSAPTLVEGKVDIYNVLFTVSPIANRNYIEFTNFLKNSIEKISLNETDANNIISTGKKISYLVIDSKLYKLRSNISIQYVLKFLMGSRLLTTSFEINSNLGVVKYSLNEILDFERKGNRVALFEKCFLKATFIGKTENGRDLENSLLRFGGEDWFWNWVRWTDSEKMDATMLFPLLLKESNIKGNIFSNDIQPFFNNGELVNSRIEIPELNIREDVNFWGFNIENPLLISMSWENNNYLIMKEYNIKDLEKLDGFKVEKIDFSKYINNLSKLIKSTK